ncbi:hypothetical protein GCM10010519_59680 [Streptomyces lactacystinicus]
MLSPTGPAAVGSSAPLPDSPTLLTGRRKSAGGDGCRDVSFQSPVKPPEEVSPVNAVPIWVLPLEITAGD